MLFNSLSFFVFFPVVTSLYFLLPHRFRWALLLAASCVFYMWFVPAYILILLATNLISYLAGLAVERAEEARKRRYLTASCAAIVLILFVFKYFNFFNANCAALARFLGWNYSLGALNLILPMGLSFFTFQSLSYVIEVYRGQQKAERHFGIYSLYVMFYPQLVAGPIERPQSLLPQFREIHRFDYARAADGLKLMAWGMFKKVVIADRLAVPVGYVFGNPWAHEGPAFVLATVFFAFQIYCDFSGYSDICVGAAQVMGFRIMDNFNRPYFAKSIAEFWKRWHISLSTWFRDYFYISLGGNRCSVPRWQWNLFLTFLVSGLWHGANWTFVAWGALNGFYLVFSIWTRDWRKAWRRRIGLERHPVALRIGQVGTTFTLVCLAWIFFRAASLRDALHILHHLPRGWGTVGARLAAQGVQALGQASFLGIDLKIAPGDFAVAVAGIAFLLFIHWIQRHSRIRHMLADKPAPVRWLIYYAIVLAMVFFGVYGNNQFIYFQF